MVRKGFPTTKKRKDGILVECEGDRIHLTQIFSRIFTQVIHLIQLLSPATTILSVRK